MYIKMTPEQFKAYRVEVKTPEQKRATMFLLADVFKLRIDDFYFKGDFRVLNGESDFVGFDGGGNISSYGVGENRTIIQFKDLLEFLTGKEKKVVGLEITGGYKVVINDTNISIGCQLFNTNTIKTAIETFKNAKAPINLSKVCIKTENLEEYKAAAYLLSKLTNLPISAGTQGVINLNNESVAKEYPFVYVYNDKMISSYRAYLSGFYTMKEISKLINDLQIKSEFIQLNDKIKAKAGEKEIITNGETNISYSDADRIYEGIKQVIQ